MTALPASRPDHCGGLAAALIAWFRRHQRDLPWRRSPTPYAVWVSEMMLQQTQVATVIPYFERWMARFPTLEALAAADEDAVLHAWQGLGYYSRARRLLAGARAVVERHGGQLPRDPEALRALPGIGPYTAGAIASIAYNVPAPIVDGNVTRVLCRLFALRGDPARSPLEGRLWELAAALIPPGAARELNPALMELGATVCLPARPRCAECPVAAWCAAVREGVQDKLPETAARPAVAQVAMAAAVIWRGERVLLTRLPPDAPRWAGMWQFPTVELLPGETSAAGAERAAALFGMRAAAGPAAGTVRHSVTRYRITLSAFHCAAPDGDRPPPAPGIAWVQPAELEPFALPAAHRRLARLLATAAPLQPALPDLDQRR